MKRRGRAILLAVLAVAVFAAGLVWRSRGPDEKRPDAYLREYAVSEDGGSVTLEMDLSSSAGYLRTVDIQEKGTALYLTFYGTMGVNNAHGARDSFQIPLPEGCGALYVWGRGGEYRPLLQKDAAGQWREPA